MLAPKPFCAVHSPTLLQLYGDGACIFVQDHRARGTATSRGRKAPHMLYTYNLVRGM